MGVTFYKKPIDGGLPCIDGNGHSIVEILRTLPRFAAQLEADEFVVHLQQFKKVRADMLPTTVDMLPDLSGATPIGEGALTRNGEVIAKMRGIEVLPSDLPLKEKG